MNSFICNVLTFIHNNSAIILTVSTTILVIVTGIYAYFNYQLAKESKLMRELQFQAKIIVYIRYYDYYNNMIALVVENVGKNYAKNIKFFINKKLEIKGVGDISEIGFIKNGLDFVGANQKIEVFIGSAFEEFKNLDNKFTVSIEYLDIYNKIQKDEFKIDFSKYKNFIPTQSKQDVFYKIREELEKIIKELENILKEIKIGNKK